MSQQREQEKRVPIAAIAGALHISKQAIKKRAAKEAWSFAEEAVRGGRRRLYEIASLPADVRDALLHRTLAQPPALSLVPALATSTTAPLSAQPRAAEDLSEKERSSGAARLAILSELYRLADTFGKDRAIRSLEELAREGKLAPELQDLVQLANAKPGKGRALSRRRLYEWCAADDRSLAADQRIARLAPKLPGLDFTLAEDVAAVLALSRQPNKPSLLWCAKEIAKPLGVSWQPLYHRAKRYEKKLPRSVFHVGRHTGAALKALQPFRRREFLSMNPNDVWVGDGHGAKLKIAHPITGSPFVPEVTVILDVATRYAVGWSVSLSENCLAVADALRHGIARHGAPLIYYSDNGGGQKNKMFDAPITGTLRSLQIQGTEEPVDHRTGHPSNPQGRGVIERFWQTVLISLARRFETFHGSGHDRDTLKRVSRDIDQALRAMKKGEVTVLPRKLPSWPQFLDALEQAIDEYNEAHQHRSLPKLDGSHHATPAQFRAARLAETGVEIRKPTGAELAMLFMPSVVRKSIRGEVKLFNGIYFHKDLYTVADGEDVQVCYDIHDASHVWVKKISGELIAKAALDGNRDGYMPKPLVERLADQRHARRAARLQKQLDEVDAERQGIGEASAEQLLEPLELPAEPEKVVVLPSAHGRRPMFDSDAEKYRWLMEQPAEVNAEDENWLAWYRTTGEWRDLFSDGIQKAAAR